jgi:hypothetical protein
MKMTRMMATALVVLGLCLPSYGEILVYKFSLSGTYYELDGGEWQVSNRTFKGYLVLDFNYDAHSIDQAEVFTYWRDEDGRQFERSTPDLKVVQVEYGTRTQWVVMETDLEEVGGEVVGGSFMMLTGSVRERNIGVGVNHKVAATLSGYHLEGTQGAAIVKLKVSATFYPAWTYWANGDDPGEGNQDFEAAKLKVETYLDTKGYVEQ